MSTTIASTRQQIGTVRILRDRIYQDDNEDDICVLPASYPLYNDAGIIYWEMQGKHSALKEKADIVPRPDISEGLFLVFPAGDYIQDHDETRVVKSKTFSHDEFRDFIATAPECKEGTEQRLVVTLENPASFMNALGTQKQIVVRCLARLSKAIDEIEYDCLLLEEILSASQNQPPQGGADGSIDGDTWTSLRAYADLLERVKLATMAMSDI